MATAFGIDVGGSGVKGALVDLENGTFIGERLRIPTPYPATPDAVADTAAQIVESFEIGDDVPVGVCFPAPLPGGKVPFIANLDQDWVGKSVSEEFAKRIGHPVAALNDADAAGVAEATFGIFKDKPGVVIFTTLGTGIGSAVFLDGKLLPNTELGHLEIDGHDAESRAAASIRTREELSFKKWAKRLQRYYEEIEKLFSPDLIVVGGGVSKKHEKFLPLLDLRCEILPAELRNTAGIVGAAAYAAQKL